MPAPIIVFLHDARHDRVYQAVSLVATASRMGRAAYLCLFYDALGSFMAGRWDDAGASGFERWDGPGPTEILVAARAEGATVFACSTSVRLLDLDAADVMERVDAVVGLATMLEAASDGALVVYL